MSSGLICDQCGTTLRVNSHGEDDMGESAGWITVETTFGSFDCCTRSCAIALMDDPTFVAHVEAGLEAIAEVVRVLQEDDDDV